MRIKITADSTCDLSPELIRENDIEIFPLFINMGDKSYLDGVTIQPADILRTLQRAALCAARLQCPSEPIASVLKRCPRNMTASFM